MCRWHFISSLTSKTRGKSHCGWSPTEKSKRWKSLTHQVIAPLQVVPHHKPFTHCTDNSNLRRRGKKELDHSPSFPIFLLSFFAGVSESCESLCLRGYLPVIQWDLYISCRFLPSIASYYRMAHQQGLSHPNSIFIYTLHSNLVVYISVADTPYQIVVHSYLLWCAG